MGFFGKGKKADFLSSDQQRRVFAEVESMVGDVGNGFSIRSAIVVALTKKGLNHMGLGSSAETTMTNLVGQACGLRNASLDDVDMHCKSLAPDKLKHAINQASSWS